MDQFSDRYNDTYRTTIKRIASDVNRENESKVLFSIYRYLSNLTRRTCIFKSVDLARTSKHKMTFENGYEKNWTEELFLVTECVTRILQIFRVKDFFDECIEENSYTGEFQEMQPKKDICYRKSIEKT